MIIHLFEIHTRIHANCFDISIFLDNFLFCGIFDSEQKKSRNAPKRNLRSLEHAFLSYYTFYYLFESLFEEFIVCNDPGADLG